MKKMRNHITPKQQQQPTTRIRICPNVRYVMKTIPLLCFSIAPYVLECVKGCS